jgi:hypothetical protein
MFWRAGRHWRKGHTEKCDYSVVYCCSFAKAVKMPGMTDTSHSKADAPAAKPEPAQTAAPTPPKLPPEIGGAQGPEPTRYGDWAHKGRCSDF